MNVHNTSERNSDSPRSSTSRGAASESGTRVSRSTIVHRDVSSQSRAIAATTHHFPNDVDDNNPRSGLDEELPPSRFSDR